MTIQDINNTQIVNVYSVKVRELAGADGMLKGADQIAGYMLGDRSLSPQIEEAARLGGLPHFRLNGGLCSTKTALERYAYRILGGAEPRGRKERRRRKSDHRGGRRERASVPTPFRCALSKGKILALTPEGKVVVVTVAAQNHPGCGPEAAA